MKIVHAPHPVLTIHAKPVAKIDGKVRTLVKGMTITLIAQKDPEGVGLAAPQVGVCIRLFIIKKNKKAPLKVFINPIILKRADIIVPANSTTPSLTELDQRDTEEPTKLEGCLSIPRIWGKVTRTKKLTLEYSTLDAKTYTKDFSGFEATIIEHEMDHLDGILFTKRVLEQGHQLYKEERGELVKYEI